MTFNNGTWYLIKSVNGGSVLLAKYNPPAGATYSFPIMFIEESYNLSSFICSGDFKQLSNYSLHLSFAMEVTNDVLKDIKQDNTPVDKDKFIEDVIKADKKDFETKYSDLVRRIEYL